MRVIKVIKIKVTEALSGFIFPRCVVPYYHKHSTSTCSKTTRKAEERYLTDEMDYYLID